MSVLCQENQASLEKLVNNLPEKPLFSGKNQDLSVKTAWLLSPEPYNITQAQSETILSLGPALHKFSFAIDKLYKQGQKDPDLAWVTALFDAGKPEALVKFARMNRFKHDLPMVIRPDLLVTADGFCLCEIDAVPGGIGFTTALSKAYQAAGFELLGSPDMAQAFLKMLLTLAPTEVAAPAIGVIVSDEAGDYRDELNFLVSEVRKTHPDIYLVHPKQVALERNAFGFVVEDGHFVALHIIYRFFELFDLANIPQVELIQYAVKKGLVVCTPPFKPHLEEKLALGLLWYPRLEAYFKAELGDSNFALLKSVVPETWILDPAPVPPHAAIEPALNLAGKRYANFESLTSLTQKQRELVIKPSGFSPLAWGSRGVSIGHDMPQEAWQETLGEAFKSFEQTPHLLQRFEAAKALPYRYFHPVSGEVVEAEGRTRLCPYYFSMGETVELAGVLATTCPKDKKVIHGMVDGVMRPAYIAP